MHLLITHLYNTYDLIELGYVLSMLVMARTPICGSSVKARQDERLYNSLFTGEFLAVLVNNSFTAVPIAVCKLGSVRVGPRNTLAEAALVNSENRTSLRMHFQSRNTITTNSRYGRSNRVIGRDLIATGRLAYGKYRWRRVEAIGLTGSVTLGVGGVAAKRWIDGHASCRHFRSMLQGKLYPHPVTDLPNS